MTREEIGLRIFEAMIAGGMVKKEDLKNALCLSLMLGIHFEAVKDMSYNDLMVLGPYLKPETKPKNQETFEMMHAHKPLFKFIGQKPRKILKAAGINTLGDLAKKSRVELRELGISDYYIEPIIRELESMGAYNS